ncbi:MAG: glycosyltransferase family 2 protein [Segetibacter sp.]
MKISICIPQYNRINYLLRSLTIIEEQTYSDIEIVISDDCSTDETEIMIKELTPRYKYPIIFNKNEKNEGYDRNYRKCIELATGEYAFVIGNDDTIYGKQSISFLVNFLRLNNFPDVGFCNMIEERTNNTLIERAAATKVIGKGPDVATKYYSCFSFVGGLIYKISTFNKFNTAKYDGSIYAQMYLGVLMIASGNSLFSIKEPLVLKDLLLEGKFRSSYRDRIAKKWIDFKIVDGGLPSVMNVLINALADAGALTQKRALFIFKRMYSITYPHWILDYKENNALPEAFGLTAGMYPVRNKNLSLLRWYNKLFIVGLYSSTSIAALITPVFLFKKMKTFLYQYFKR